MQARLSAFVVWALVAAGVAFWGLRLLVRPAALPAHAQVVGSSTVAAGDFTRMFGRATIVEREGPAPVASSSRFKLLGVLAPVARADKRPDAEIGVALIAVDGKTARPYAVGATIDAGLILQSVNRRSASIGPSGGAASVLLELPPPAAPATGTLPVATSQYESAPPQATAAQAPPSGQEQPEGEPAGPLQAQPTGQEQPGGVPAAPLPIRRSNARNPAAR